MVRVKEGRGSVVLEERLQEHANGPKDTDKDKDPEEQAVDHHGNVFPILPHTLVIIFTSHMVRNEAYTVHSFPEATAAWAHRAPQTGCSGLSLESPSQALH